MRFTRWHRRPRPTGELGRLLDAWPGPGSSLGFAVDGESCTWLEGSCCAPGPRPRAKYSVAAMVADAELAGLDRDQLADALARIDDPARREVLARAAGRDTAPALSPAAVSREAARAVWPRLVVKRAPLPRQWWWEVKAPDGRTIDAAPADSPELILPTQAAALEVGLAHLAVQSAAWALDVHGAVLPEEWVRIVPQ